MPVFMASTFRLEASPGHFKLNDLAEITRLSLLESSTDIQFEFNKTARISSKP